MKDNWNELFDSMKEDDILRNLPEDLPEMKDELAAKRIENRVMQEMKIDLDLQKKQGRKRLLAAVVACIAVVGAIGHKPIMAAFQRLFHDLPGVGLYINDTDAKVYEVWIDDPVQEKDGVRVELRDFYCEGKQIYGTVRITGENLLDMTVERTHEEEDAALDEKFPTTWYYGEESKKFHDRSGSRLTEGGKLKIYNQKGSEWNYIEKGIDTYYLEVGGFDRIFTLKLVEPKTVETPEEIGYSQELNGTTITARAAIVDDMIEVECYMIPSAEVKLANENRTRYYISMIPYQFDFTNVQYVENAAGERMKHERYRNLENGIKFWYQGSEKDFPLTFHKPTLTGSSNESYMMELKLPQDGGTITENLPKFDFKYGTVEILYVKKEIGEYNDHDVEDPKFWPASIVDIIYRVTPKDGVRQMYDVEVVYDDEQGEIYGGGNFDTGDDFYVNGQRIFLKDLEKDTLKMKLHMPSFWIVGDYDIVIEKPNYRTDNASAIDVEADVEDEYFNIG